jgi:hypothetical protein
LTRDFEPSIPLHPLRLGVRKGARIWIHSRSQLATLKRGQNIKYLLYAFNEDGAFMAASALNSEQAIQLNIQMQEDL